MAREKRPQEKHNFKAGSLNALVGHLFSVWYSQCFSRIAVWNKVALCFNKSRINSFVQIRVSSVISNSPVIMNVDCDMYSNNSESIRDALCFFLDEEQGQDIGFVQYPQNFDNVVHNDIYGNPINVVNEVNRKMILHLLKFQWRTDQCSKL
jgi:hypothetical protein